jgi:hypothetical protein
MELQKRQEVLLHTLDALRLVVLQTVLVQTCYFYLRQLFIYEVIRIVNEIEDDLEVAAGFDEILYDWQTLAQHIDIFKFGVNFRKLIFLPLELINFQHQCHLRFLHCLVVLSH